MHPEDERTLSRRGLLAGTLGFAAASALARAGAGEPAYGTLPAEEGFDEWVRCRMRESRVPGLSLAILDGGRLVRSAAYGWADIGGRRAMETDTLVNIASVTKTITGTAVMQLVERGKLALDDDVSRLQPVAVRNPAHPGVPITVRQLLTHTSSIADGPAYDEIYRCGDHPVSTADWLRDYLGREGRLYDASANFHAWAPGAYRAYSNIGYGLLGQIVETTSGLSYPAYCAAHIFAPLGMGKTRMRLAGMPAHAHAVPYAHSDDDAMGLRDPSAAATADGQIPLCLYSFVTEADGLVRTSADELARFLMAMLHGGTLDGARILEAATVAAMLADQRVEPPPGTPPGDRRIQGISWYRHRDSRGSPAWAHSGGDPGVGTYAAIRPADGRGVVVLANTDDHGGLPGDVARRVLGDPVAGTASCRAPG